MIPYTCKFILNDKPSETVISFRANEKPVKGEVFTIEQSDGTLIEVKVTEITKVVVANKEGESMLEYRCKTERHEERATTIGFGKRG